jgi:hypothetical protein
MQLDGYIVCNRCSYACLLLEIRKSMGNENTQLDLWEMIEWFMKDAAEK